MEQKSDKNLFKFIRTGTPKLDEVKEYFKASTPNVEKCRVFEESPTTSDVSLSESFKAALTLVREKKKAENEPESTYNVSVTIRSPEMIETKKFFDVTPGMKLDITPTASSDIDRPFDEFLRAKRSYLKQQQSGSLGDNESFKQAQITEESLLEISENEFEGSGYEPDVSCNVTTNPRANPGQSSKAKHSENNADNSKTAKDCSNLIKFSEDASIVSDKTYTIKKSSVTDNNGMDVNDTKNISISNSILSDDVFM